MISGDIPLDEVLHFDVITSSPTTGAASDADSTPTFAVYEEATDTDIGVGGNLTKRTSLTGNYRGTFTASAANGFEVGKFYSIIASATVETIAAKCVAGSFRITAAEHTAGYHISTIKDGTGTGEIDTTSGGVLVAAIAANAITASAIADNAIDAGALAADCITAEKIAAGAIDAATFAADVDAEILSYIVDDATRIDASALNTAAVTSIPAILADTGTDGVIVASIANNAITAAAIADNAIDAGALAADCITAAKIADGAIDAATFANDAITAAKVAADVGTEIGTAVWATTTRILTASTNLGDLDDAVLAILGTPAGASLAADIAAIEAQTDDIGTAGAGLSAVPWNAAWDAEVQSEVADALGVYDPPTNAEMEARTLAAADYATAAALDTVDNFLDTEVAAIKAKTDNLPSDPADASDISGAFSTVNSTLATIATYIDTEVAAVKAQTDKLTFDGSNRIVANLTAAGLDSDAANEIADALLDRTSGIESSYTLRQALRIILAACGGKSSGHETGTPIYRNPGDSKDRISAVTDADGNRTSVTLDVS